MESYYNLGIVKMTTGESGRELFPEITFYNSPKEVILQLKEKITKVSILNQTI